LQAIRREQANRHLLSLGAALRALLNRCRAPRKVGRDEFVTGTGLIQQTFRLDISAKIILPDPDVFYGHLLSKFALMLGTQGRTNLQLNGL
jgi:hypothetical protein